MLVDLHTHSTFSDGRYTPTMLVKTAAAKKISVLSITDHDSWNGIAEARQVNEELNLGVRIITGVELGTQFADKSVHILGYHVSTDCSSLQQKMDEMRHAREHRLTKMLAKLDNLGFHIEVEACDPKNRAVGRPHVAKALVAQGYFASVQEVFDALLYQGGPGYVPQPKLSPLEAVDLIHQARGIAVLAHPSEIESLEVIKKLLDEVSFDGLEVYHPSADAKMREYWLKIANSRGLLISGGSDFHGIPDRFPKEMGIWQVNYNDVQGVVEWK